MKRRVIVELKYSANLEQGFMASLSNDEDNAKKLSQKAIPKITGFVHDSSFSTVAVPQEFSGSARGISEDEPDDLYDTEAGIEFNFELSESTYLVRGEVDDKNLDKFESNALSKREVVAVYSDPDIQPTIICPNSAPLGTDKTVEKLLNISRLHKCKANGAGVRVAIVDTGVNMKYLATKGKTPSFDAAGSWKPATSTVTPGSAPVGHGTMCAYDVCIAAPKCTILDIALLTTRRTGSTVMEGFLSDAILAYRHLINLQRNVSPRPGVNKSLVVNNSWGMFHPSWDYPVGHPGNYSDNPNHPFNRIVRSLERCGADILFAAGNCGKDCPDGRCQGVTTKTIYGANSSPYVLTVAGVDTSKKRVGYSSIGPGRLTTKKPDISGYTHFKGSDVYAADGGTSAACPVVAGVVASIRTRRPLDFTNSATRPAAIRNLVRSTAQDLGPTGFDYETGFGVINGNSLATKLKCPQSIDDLCRRYPRFCRLWKICQRYPQLCRRLKLPSGPKIVNNTTQEYSANFDMDDDLGSESDMLNFFFGSDSISPEELDVLEKMLPESAKMETGEKKCNCSK